MINQLMPPAAPQGPGIGAAPPQMAPQGGPPQVSPQELADARTHTAVMMHALMGLAAKPKGALSKQDVFSAAGDMIAGGAFSTPQAKQQLVAEIAQMPDDEIAIRQAVGAHLMTLARVRDTIHQHFGAEG